jgi:hypothetical protein
MSNIRLTLFRSVQPKLMEDEDDNPLSEKYVRKSEYWANVSKFIDAPYVKYLYNLVMKSLRV